MTTNKFVKKKNKLLFKIIFFFIVFTNLANANCTNTLKLTQSNIKNIEVDFIKYRKWIKNLTRILVKPNNSVELRKKRFKANIIFELNNGLKCSLPASVRAHGDLQDHQELINGNPISSLNINLKRGNIDNITKFILFIPKSRRFDNEIFIATLLKELNYLSPATFYINAKVGQINRKYIFQEKIEKEFLERNKKIEGPIIEGYENFTKSYKKPARISNMEWVKDSHNKLIISAAALSDMNSFIFNHSNSAKEWTSENDILSFDNNYLNLNEISLLNSYETFLFALDITHGAAISDRRFYYDIIYNEYHPIYYDGNSQILSEKNLKPLRFNTSDYLDQILTPYPKPYVTKEAWLGADYAFDLISSLDIEKFNNQLKTNKLNINKKVLLEKLNLIKKRIQKIKENEPPNSFFEYPKNFYSKFFVDDNINSKFIFFEKKNKNFFEIKICNFDLSKCDYDNATLENFKFILEQKNENLTNEELFISNNFNQYKNGFFNRSSENLRNFKKHTYDNINIFTNEFVSHSVDSENKIIEINYFDSDGRVIINNSHLKDFTILFHNKFINSLSKETNFYGITGCLLISDSYVDNITIQGSNSACEDSINFLRTNGNVKLLKIFNSAYDAIDADFSNLNFDKIIVEKSGNDCLDFSYGEYYISNATISNCGDKGISVGEKSLLNLESGMIEEIEIGVASKDESITNLKNLQISKFRDKCFAAYQKKQEFGMGLLFSEKVFCTEKS